MKKILALFFLFMIFLVGCFNNKKKIDYYNELKNFIPNSLTENLLLPNYEKIKTDWSTNYSIIVNNCWIYKEPSKNLDMTLTCKLNNKDKNYVFNFKVKVLRKDKYYYEKELSKLIPKTLDYDLILPTFNNLFTWSSNEAVIYNNKLIYDFPTNDKFVRLIGKSSKYIIYYDLIFKNMNNIENLAKINLACTDKIDSKENYVNGIFQITTINKTKSYYMKTRLRGNSSFMMEKKSYKIKLEEKQTLLNLKPNKDYVLLANYADQTLIRNALAFNFSKRIRNGEWTPSYRFVDLYLNKVYQGNYLLVEQIEEGKNKIDVENNGYYLEYDYRAKEENILNKEYFFISNVPHVIKYPNTDILSVNEFNKIKNEVNFIFEKLTRNDIKDIDLESFVTWFFVNELMKNADSGYSSVYLYKKNNEKLKMGPVWDFDLSSGNFGHIEYQNRNPYGWYTNLHYKNIWFYELFKSDIFKTCLKETWASKIKNEALKILDDINDLSNLIRKSRYNNFLKWDVIGKNNEWYTSSMILEADTYYKQIDLLYNFLSKRISWIDNELNKF